MAHDARGTCASGCPRTVADIRTSRFASKPLFSFPHNMSTLAYRPRPRMSEEVKAIPEAYFSALWAARAAYAAHCINYAWVLPCKAKESPTIGSYEWRREHRESMSSHWHEYRQALDSLLDDIESQVGHSIQSQNRRLAVKTDIQRRRTLHSWSRFNTLATRPASDLISTSPQDARPIATAGIEDGRIRPERATPLLRSGCLSD